MLAVFIFLSNIYLSSSKCQPFLVKVSTVSGDLGALMAVDFTVHQCQGQDEGPVKQNMQCVNTTKKLLPGKFFYDEENKLYNEVYNHTSCQMKYVCDQNGVDPSKIHPGVCYFDEKWNATACECENRKKSRTNYACKPMGSTPSSIQLKLFVTALFVEFVGLVLIGYIIWRRTQKNNANDANENNPSASYPFQRTLSNNSNGNNMIERHFSRERSYSELNTTEEQNDVL